MSRVVSTLLFALLPIALLACANPIVGGECIEGYSVCRGACVDLQNDRTNCGACGNTCPSASMCVAGACTIGEGGVDLGRADAGDAGERDGATLDADVLDGDLRDGEVQDGASADASVLDGAVLDGSVDDGGATDAGLSDAGSDDGGPIISCDIGEIRCGTACVRSDAASCGMCGNACLPAEVCSTGMCASICDPPLVACARNCVDLQSDPDHCGSCPNVCATGICIDALCSSGTAGHVVLIGHDFTTTRASMNRIAGNSVFLGAGAPVRVLVYEGRARAASITGTDLAINQVSTSGGRSWTRIPVTRTEVPLMLASANVLVVYAQRDESDAELQAIGTEWGIAMTSFVRRGGVVVVFDTGGSANAGTFQLLSSAGLLAVTARTVITGAIVEVDAAALGDAVAIGVPAMYRSATTTVRFATTDPLTVVRDDTGPVVVHRVVAP